MINLIIWIFICILLCILSTLGCAFKPCRFIMLSILFLPLLITVSFYIFKHSTVETKEKDLFFSRWKIGAHRGSHCKQPENTLLAFAAAKKEGAQLVEFDIQLTKELIPIISHDETTGRMTDKNYIIAQTPFDELRKLHVKYQVGNQTVYGPIMPTLNETIEWCIANDMLMLFDVKDSDNSLIQYFVTTIKERNLYDKVIISSFYPNIPYKIKSADKNVLTGVTWKSTLLSTLDEDGSIPSQPPSTLWIVQFLDSFFNVIVRTLWLPQFLGVDMVLAHHYDIDVNLVLESRRNNIQLTMWTSNNSIELSWMRLFDIPFLTDCPTYFINRTLV